MFGYITIVYPKRKVLDRREKTTSILLQRSSLAVDVHNLPQQVSVEKAVDDITREWQESITTKHGYESFANYLAQQFSVEVQM